MIISLRQLPGPVSSGRLPESLAGDADYSPVEWLDGDGSRWQGYLHIATQEIRYGAMVEAADLRREHRLTLRESDPDPVAVNNANHAMSNVQQLVVYTATLAAPRTVTLPSFITCEDQQVFIVNGGPNSALYVITIEKHADDAGIGLVGGTVISAAHGEIKIRKISANSIWLTGAS